MKTLIAAVVTASLGAGAQAQDFYAGAALDYGFPHSGDSQTLGTLIGGVGLSTNADFGFGAEIEFGQHIAGDADYDTQRFRLWGSYDLGSVTARVAGGVTQYDLGDSDPEGYNLGLGVERAFSDRVTFRGEFIRDFMDDTFTAAVTTTRIGVFYTF